MDNPEVIRQLGLMVIVSSCKLKYFILLYPKQKKKKSISLLFSAMEFCPFSPFSLFHAGFSPWHSGRHGSAGQSRHEPGPGAHSSTGKILHLAPQLPLAQGNHKPKRCWCASMHDRFVFLGRMNWQITVSESDWASTSLVLSDTPQFLGFYVIQVSVSHH